MLFKTKLHFLVLFFIPFLLVKEGSSQVLSIDRISYGSFYDFTGSNKVNLVVVLQMSESLSKDSIQIQIDNSLSFTFPINQSQPLQKAENGQSDVKKSQEVSIELKTDSKSHSICSKLIRNGEAFFTSKAIQFRYPTQIQISSKDKKNIQVFKSKISEARLEEFKALKHLILLNESSKDEVLQTRCCLKRGDLVNLFGVPDIQESNERIGYYLKGRFKTCHVLFVLDQFNNVLNYTINLCE